MLTLACCYLEALFVAVGGASRRGTLQLGEDHDVLVEENVPHARPLPPGAPAHCQLALPHQLAALRHGDLKRCARSHARLQYSGVRGDKSCS